MALKELLELAPCRHDKTEATGSIVSQRFTRVDLWSLRNVAETCLRIRENECPGGYLRNRGEKRLRKRRVIRSPMIGGVANSRRYQIVHHQSLSLACSDAISGIVALSAPRCKKYLPARSKRLTILSQIVRRLRVRNERGRNEARGAAR